MKRSIEQLEAAARAAEERARKYREQAKEATKAEQEKINVAIIKAVDEWMQSLPKNDRPERSDMPRIVTDALGLFRPSGTQTTAKGEDAEAAF